MKIINYEIFYVAPRSRCVCVNIKWIDWGAMMWRLTQQKIFHLFSTEVRKIYESSKVSKDIFPAPWFVSALVFIIVN